jgi:hypothetical protein
MEHLDENRINALAAVIFGDARPGTVVLTTPNIEYNEIYGLSRFRHRDHRFEWNRARFRSWAEEIAERYAYRVRFEDIGGGMGGDISKIEEKLGAPTQMGVFVKCL